MCTPRELDPLREQAIPLHRQGEPPPPDQAGPRPCGDQGLTEREILIAGAVAYRCEGARNKPHRRVDRVTFANSDPELISFLLLFLDTAGIPRSDLAFQLQIHGTADVAAAIRFWLTVTAARPDQFRKVSLKQGNPLTTRKNTGDGYYGCLRVDVRRSCELYRKIEGWASAVTAGAEVPGCSTTVG
jgi:hypothetical protein